MINPVLAAGILGLSFLSVTSYNISLSMQHYRAPGWKVARVLAVGAALATIPLWVRYLNVGGTGL